MHESPSGKTTNDVFSPLLRLIQTLLAENGCPWDRKQTPQTIYPYILEEYHEMVEAITHGTPDEIADETGDLLFLVVFVAYLLEKQGIATLKDIIDRVVAKMMRRHPHVFGNTVVRDAQDVVTAWSAIKATEETIRNRESLLDGIPRSLPALTRAQKLSNRAAKVGFDWTRAEEVLPKIDEELAEFKHAVGYGSLAEIREELGDLLFVIVNAARHLGINSEAALTEANSKFERRFRYVEHRLQEAGIPLSEAGLERMDALWSEAKKLKKESTPPNEPT